MPAPFDIDSITGLTEHAASDRLRQEGHNELPSTKQRSLFAIAFDVVREPMFLLLVACGALYLFLGDVQEALMLIGFVFVVVGITLYQERKTEALEALRGCRARAPSSFATGNRSAFRDARSSAAT